MKNKKIVSTKEYWGNTFEYEHNNAGEMLSQGFKVSVKKDPFYEKSTHKNNSADPSTIQCVCLGRNWHTGFSVDQTTYIFLVLYLWTIFFMYLLETFTSLKS